MSASSLTETRQDLRVLLRDYSKRELSEKTEEQAFKDEAEYAASGLQSDDIMDRIRGVEFLEILGDNPYAQDHLLTALSDREGSVVQKALQALGKVAGRRSIPKLQAMMRISTSKYLLLEIGRVIGKIERKVEL